MMVVNVDLRQLGAFLDVVPDAVLIVDERGQIIKANLQVKSTFGYGPDELVGRLIEELLPDRFHRQHRQHRAAFARQPTIRPMGRGIDIWARHKEGREFPAAIKLNPLRLSTGIDAVCCLVRDISRERQIVKAQEESNRRFRNLAHHVPAWIYILDLSTNQVIFFNRDEFLGYSREELMVRGAITKNIHPDDTHLIMTDFKNMLVAKETGPIEYRARHKEGHWEWVMSQHAILTENEDGRPEQVVFMLEVISERKRVEETERQYAQQLEALRALGLEMATQLDQDKLLESIVEHAVQLLDADSGGLYLYRPEQDALEWIVAYGPNLPSPGVFLVRGQGASGKVWATNRPLIIDNYQEWRGRAEIYDEYQWHAVLAVPVRWGGQFLGVINVLADSPQFFSERDQELLELFATQAATAIHNARLYQQARQEIAERRQIETALRESLRLIERAKLDWEATADSFDQIIGLLDQDGKLIRINRAVRAWNLGDVIDIFGRPLHSLLHPDCSDSSCYFAAYWQQAWPAVLAGRHSRQEVHDPVLNRYLRLQLWPIERPLEELPRSAVIVIEDLTEEKQVQEAVQRAQKLESLGVMAGGIAHDFNNLLAGIMSECGLALLQLPVTSPAYQNIENATRVVERAASLTRQLLAYAGKGQVQAVPLDLNALIRENLLLLGTTIPRHIELALDLAEDLPQITADAGQIQQVIMNLILNAAEAYNDQPGRVEISTRIATEPQAGHPPTPGQWICFTVADQGVGIDPEMLPRIFDPFFTTKFAGRGLGLSAVLGIIRQHRGDIQVDSQFGQGTTFKVYFPARQTPAPVQDVPSNALQVDQATVLIIDDEMVIRTAVADFLRLQNLTVLAAKNGLEGLALYREHDGQIDLVLLDLTMPVMSGKQTLLELHRLRPDLPVLLLSGYGEEETIQQLSQSKYVEFLQKPFRLPKVLEKINKLLLAH